MSEHATRSVWDRRLATVTQLCADPDWPLGQTATYQAIRRGEIPTTRLGGRVMVLVPALAAQLGIAS